MRISVGIALLALVLWGGCSGLHVDVEQTGRTVIPAGSVVQELLGGVGFGQFSDMDITHDEAIENQGIEPGDIDEARVTEFRLDAADPPGADLSFIDDMQIYVEAPDLPRVLVASQSDFPEGADSVSFDLEDVDLTEYVVSQSLTITTEVSGRSPDAETTIDAMVEMRVGVTQQGCNHARRES
jgi:hypothetical protein